MSSNCHPSCQCCAQRCRRPALTAFSRRQHLEPTRPVSTSRFSIWRMFSPDDTIYFYDKHKPYYEFTNFSPFTVMFRGAVYPTSEHAFQAAKFLDTLPQLAEDIRVAKTARNAFDLAQANTNQKVRNWHQIKIDIMEEILLNKFSYHRGLRALLLKTGEVPLVEDSPNDSFWGVGADRRGSNELGKALERVRSKLADS